MSREEDTRDLDRFEQLLEDGLLKVCSGAGLLLADLVRNPDILKTINQSYGRASLVEAKTGTTGVPPVALIRIGFAAETGAPAAEAARKCREKGLDLVVGNDVTEPGSGFGTATNRVTFVTPDGTVQRLPLMSKLAVARRIVSFAERRAKG